MHYIAMNGVIIISPVGIRPTILGAERENEYEFGIRELYLDGKAVKLNECVLFKVLSSSVDDLKEGDNVWIRNSLVHHIPGDKGSYWVEAEKVSLLMDKPFRNNILCRDIKRDNSLVIPDHLYVSGLVNAFVYDAGNSGLGQGDVIVYDYMYKNDLELGGEKLFVIGSEHVKAKIIN